VEQRRYDDGGQDAFGCADMQDDEDRRRKIGRKAGKKRIERLHPALGRTDNDQFGHPASLSRCRGNVPRRLPPQPLRPKQFTRSLIYVILSAAYSFLV
jgi:hypothetical protein